VNTVVLDASALLALLNEEPGAEKLTPELLRDATASTVNLAEVHSKLVEQGGDTDEAWADALSPISEAATFTEQHARIAGGLVARTRGMGLSLGDRACLALGITLRAPVYTADRAWKRLKLDVPIHVIR
jgi:ribonuclease VapC